MEQKSEFTVAQVKIADFKSDLIFTLGTTFADGEEFVASFPNPDEVVVTTIQKEGWSKPMGFVDVLNNDSGLIESVGINKLGLKILEGNRTGTYNVRAASYTKANGKIGIGLSFYQMVEKV